MYWHYVNHLKHIMSFNTQSNPEKSVLSQAHFAEMKWEQMGKGHTAQKESGFAFGSSWLQRLCFPPIDDVFLSTKS